MIKSKIKSIVLGGLLQKGRYPTVATPRDSVAALLHALNPKFTGHELIRLGPNGDGGYLLPNDLEGISALFSPGVDRESRFESACAELGLRVFLADYSVEGPAGDYPDFDFEKKFLGSWNHGHFITLESWIESKFPGNNDLLLQMDIEGFEYETLLVAPAEVLKRFRIIVIEFHHLTELWNSFFFSNAAACFHKLLGDFVCVHIHPNNIEHCSVGMGIDLPRVAEFTFLRRDRVRCSTPVDTLPHLLDCPNVDAPPVNLSGLWYGA